MSDDQGDYVSAKVGDFVKKRISDRKNRRLGDFAVDVDPDVAEWMAFTESAYLSTYGESYKSTKSFDHWASNKMTRSVSDAVATGNKSKMNAIVGVTEGKVSLNHTDTWLELQRLIKNNGSPFTALLTGEPNSGKTATALDPLLKLKMATFDDPSDFVVATNMESLEIADYYIYSIPQLHDLMTHDDLEDVEILWIFDETSTWLDAHKFSHEVTAYYTPLYRYFAKAGVTFAVHIAHSKKDCHPEVRDLVSLGIHKTEPKVAEFYATIDRQTGDLFDHMFTLTDIDDTDMSYDPDGFCYWDWDAVDASWTPDWEGEGSSGGSP